jgi:hypothetical protein
MLNSIPIPKDPAKLPSIALSELSLQEVATLLDLPPRDTSRLRKMWTCAMKEASLCCDCDADLPYWALCFDHVRGVKIATIADLVQTGTFDLLRDEVVKCTIRCATCHALVHGPTRGGELSQKHRNDIRLHRGPAWRRTERELASGYSMQR